jgi:hypothetical protein
VLKRRAPKSKLWPKAGASKMAFYTSRKTNHRWNQRYAWLPTRVAKNKWVWFTEFYQKETEAYINGKLDSIFIQCYSKEDYITMKLMGQV